MTATPLLVSVNVGLPRTVMFRGKPITTAIWKEPIEGPVSVAGVNLSGDDQADRTVHGGKDKAVYAYAAEDYAWWERELGHPLGAGTLGENLTTAGIDVTGAVVGEHWQVGTARFEVAQPRLPCFKLGIRMDDPTFPRRFSLARRPGAYLRIVVPGHIQAGDLIEIVSKPHHGLSVGEVARIYFEESDRAADLLVAPELPKGWIDWARSRAR